MSGVLLIIQAKLVQIHLEVVIQTDRPEEIPRRVNFLKEEGNRCYKKQDFNQASALYLTTIKLPCFGCIVSNAVRHYLSIWSLL